MHVKTATEAHWPNKRLLFTSLWTFTAFNYLYADVIGLMDMHQLVQFQTGVVNGMEITPQFLTMAGLYMQLPLSNIFIPQVIKNQKVVRIIQIAAGLVATVMQGLTLFVGELSMYYLLFSVIEMSVTAVIAVLAYQWKVK